MVDLKRRQSNRGPVAHIARVPLTQEEHVELQTVATRERATFADTMRKALREYADKRRA